MGTLVTLAHKKLTSEITHACTHVQLFIAGTLRQRKISSKATVRQFVRNLFSSNTRRLPFALQSFDRHSFDCCLFLHSWSNISKSTLPVCEKIRQEFNLVKKLLWRKRRNKHPDQTFLQQSTWWRRRRRWWWSDDNEEGTKRTWFMIERYSSKNSKCVLPAGY